MAMKMERAPKQPWQTNSAAYSPISARVQEQAGYNRCMPNSGLSMSVPHTHFAQSGDPSIRTLESWLILRCLQTTPSNQPVATRPQVPRSRALSRESLPWEVALHKHIEAIFSQ